MVMQRGDQGGGGRGERDGVRLIHAKQKREYRMNEDFGINGEVMDSAMDIAVV
jgi:hypothetical protein